MKKTISRLLALSMLLSLFISSANAAANDTDREREYLRLHNIIYSQLADQDALDLMEHFDPIINEMLNQKYGNSIMFFDTGYPYWYAPNGGWIKGTGSHIQVEAVFYNVEQTEHLYEHRNDTSSELSQHIINIVTGYTGWYGNILTVAMVAHQVTANLHINNVDIGNEGCYVYAVLDTFDDTTTTVIIPWDPPYMHLSSSITVTDHHVNSY